MKIIIKDLYESFKTSPGGLSARKLTAFTTVCVAAYETYIHTNDSNLTAVIMIWLSVGLLCLGIITMEQLNNFKNGTGTNKEG